MTTTNALFVGQYRAWNAVSVTDLSVHGSAAPWMRLHWLMYPMTPEADMTDEDNDTPTMMRFVDAAALAAFPARHAASPRAAIAALLTIPEVYDLPYQLMQYGLSLAARMQFIDLCVAWVSRDRFAIVRDFFAAVMAHLDALSGWLDDASAPYQSAVRMCVAMGGTAAAIGVPELVKANHELARGTYDHLWSDERDADANVEYFVCDLTGRRASAPGAASSGAPAVHVAPSPADAVLHRLYDSIVTELDEGGGEFRAIDAIYESGSGAAIRWLNGKPNKGREPLPAGFVAKCCTLPGMQHEYLLDAIKRLDDGTLDKDLEGLDMSVFEQGVTAAAKARFFVLFFNGNFSVIDWEKDFIQRIAVFLDPAAAAFTLEEALRDPDRRAMHVLYIGRALDAVGKPPSADESLAALVGHIEHGAALPLQVDLLLELLVAAFVLDLAAEQEAGERRERLGMTQPRVARARG